MVRGRNSARAWAPAWMSVLALVVSGCPHESTGTDSGTPPTNMCGYTGTDSDGDGLPDSVEDFNGDGVVGPGECDPFVADTDGDGLVDSVEVGCDGLGKPGVDTFCDNPDSDGDGVFDGLEDANGDGVFNPEAGETDPTNPDTDSDGCPDGAEYTTGTSPTDPDSDGDGLPDGQEDFNCDGVVDPEQGETDPMNVDTDGDGVPDSLEPTFICVDPGKFGVGGRRPVAFHENEQGDWRLGLEANSTSEGRTVSYVDIALSNIINPFDVRAAAAFDYTENHPSGLAEVSGFVASIPTDTNFDGNPDTGMFDNISARDRILGLIETVFPTGSVSTSITTRSAGNAVVSWEGFDAVVNVVVEVNLVSSNNPGAVRATLLPALLSASAPDLTNLPLSFGSTASSFIISFEALYRADPRTDITFPGRVMVMGSVVAKDVYDDNNNITSIRASDLANGTGLAQYGDADANECDPFDVVSLPVADIFWVIDDSGSTDTYRTSIKDNAVDLFDRAIAAGLDFRMGVISMGPKILSMNRPFLCDPPIGASVPGLGASCSNATPVPASYNDQPADGRWISPFERDAFGWCICHPPNGDGGTEYGLENGREAVMSSLPRDSGNPRKLRPEATMVVIYVGDETAQGVGYNLSAADVVPGAANYIAHIQPQIDLFNGVANPLNMYPPGADPSMSIGRAHGIVGIPGGSCSFNAAYGYEQVVNGVGGVLGSVCAGALGPSLQTIIDDIIGQASPLELERTPISLSLACAINDMVAARSRMLGFDYSASSNSIIFFGLGMMLEDADVACSYKYPIDDSPYDEGTPGLPIE